MTMQAENQPQAARQSANVNSEYSYSTDEERYHGSFSTPEGAALEGFQEEYECGNDEANSIFVGENVPPVSPESYIDADLILEHIQCQDEYQNEWSEDWPGCTKTQRDELTSELQKTVLGWIERHKLQPHFWTVINVRKITKEQCGFKPPSLPAAVQPDEE